MADGFQGIDIVSSKQTAIQTPIGFFGLSVSIVDAPNLFIKVVDCHGRSVRNCVVTTSNPTSGIPKSNNTDYDGNVALKSDAISTITVVNNKVSESFAYNRSTQGNYVELCFKTKLLI